MSFFDLYRAEHDAVQHKLRELRIAYPSARIDARVESGVVVLSGEVDSTAERDAILTAFRSLNPDLTPVVSGGLKRRPQAVGEEPADYSRQPPSLSRTQRLAMSSRTTKRIYRVQAGDTLPDIALKFYGDTRAYVVVAAVNGELIEQPGQLEPGWLLEIPESASYHTRDGDCLELIAERFYGDRRLRSLLVQANPELASTNEPLKPNQPVRIPFHLG